MNALGNRYVGNNLRILLINNGLGQEFKNDDNRASLSGLGDKTNPFIAAEGHFGSKSENLVRDFATDLGFEYLSARNKDEFLRNLNYFVNPEIKKAVVFEAFIDSDDESKAYEMMKSIRTSTKGKVKSVAKNLMGEEKFGKLKKKLLR